MIPSGMVERSETLRSMRASPRYLSQQLITRGPTVPAAKTTRLKNFFETTGVASAAHHDL
jgi:hypothetical protein